jgi:hypothetical protein
MYFGNDAGASSAVSFPHTVVKMYGKDVLVINRNLNKEIAVSLYVYGDDGRPIITLKDNNFELNPHGDWSREQKSDKTSLIVYDGQHTRVLDIKYFNEAAVGVMGIFEDGNFRITVNGDQMVLPQGTMRGFCNAGTYNDLCVGSAEQCR